MKINNEQLNYNISVNFKLAVNDIAHAVIDRVEFDEIEDDDELCDALRQAMDDELIYTTDLWEIMKYYQTPAKADLTEALGYLFDDLLTTIRKSIEQ